MTARRTIVPPKPEEKGERLPLVVVGALGVVFGDIGTSPLYAFRQCFTDLHTGTSDAEAVLGILSLIFWSLVAVVCIKYVTFIMRAEHEGEGGILAMLGLIYARHPRSSLKGPGLVTLIVFLGAALLYGDGVITPAISVLSAVEGLKVVAPSTQSFIVPLAVAILAGMFLLQSRGTGRVGSLFGPVMLVWFVALAVLGGMGVAEYPGVLWALNPQAAVLFFEHHGWQAMLTLGGVVLCFSGAEALFADLGHFGRRPIVAGWYGVVLPALLLNYFGQGALLLRHPGQLQTPFFNLVPHFLLYPVVVLATLATVIASQALISGAFSLTEQAIHMGYFPRLEVIHTSRVKRGQTYVPVLNYGLMLACIGVVLAFQSSERLGSAYGLAVIGTMTATSLTYFTVLRRVWRWRRAPAALLTGAFLLLDGAFLAGNVVKIASGAWLPLVLGLLVFAVFWIWTDGRARFHRALRTWSMPLDHFKRAINSWKHRHESTAVFLTGHANAVPLMGRNHWLRAHAHHEQVILLTVTEEKVPYVRLENALKVEQLGPELWRITAPFGFMQHPDVTRVLQTHCCHKLRFNGDKLVFYLPQPRFVAKGGIWRRSVLAIFEFLARNSLATDEYFRIPPGDIIHVGVRLEF
jgi:KUP system potassium uptake protein